MPSPVVLIADDEPLARNLIRRYATSQPGLEIVAECATSDEFADALGRVRPDLVLLDIRMPGPDIFSVLAREAAGPRPLPSVIFATAFDGYAVRAFDLNAIDYLVKPYSEDRFAEAIRRVRTRQAAERQTDRLERVIRDLGPHPDRLLVPDGRRMVPLAIADIVWIKAEDDYARVFAGGRSYLVSRTLKDLEARLDPERFVRAHRTSIVNLDHVVAFRRAGRGMVAELTDGTRLPVSRQRAKELRALAR